MATNKATTGLISAKEASGVLGLSRQTLSNFAKRGLIHVLKNGNSLYYNRSDVEALAGAGAESTRLQEEIKQTEAALRKRLTELRRELEAAETSSPRWLRYDGTFVPVARACLEFERFYLPRREYECLRRYIIDGQTLEEIGQLFCLTRERVRQIIERSVKRMLTDATSVRKVMEDYYDTKDDNEVLFNWAMTERKQNAELRKENEILRQGLLTKPSRPAVRLPYWKDDAMRLIDTSLSIRCINALKACGIERIGDMRGMTPSKLMQIRNLGRKSVREIMDVLHISEGQEC